jgi:hypothetical protein
LYQSQDWRNIQNQLKDKREQDEALNIELILLYLNMDLKENFGEASYSPLN